MKAESEHVIPQPSPFHGDLVSLMTSLSRVPKARPAEPVSAIPQATGLLLAENYNLTCICLKKSRGSEI